MLMYLKNQKHTPPYILLPTVGSVTHEYTETHSKLDLLTFTYMLICNAVFLYCHFKHFKHTQNPRECHWGLLILSAVIDFTRLKFA